MPLDPEPSPIDADSPQPETPSTPLSPPGPEHAWNLRDLLLFIGIIPFALLASKLLVLIGYSVLRPFMDWHEKVDVAQYGTIFLLTQQCVFYVLIVGFLFLLATLQHQEPFWRSLGWRKPTARQVVRCLLAGGALALAAGVALALRPDRQSFPLEQLFNSRTSAVAIGVFAISVAPVVEEVVFRGLLFAIFENRVGMRFAVVTTAVLFAGLHVPEYWHAWNHLVMILVVGIVLSLVRGITGSLTPSIFLHIGYNGFMIAGLLFSSQQPHSTSSVWVR